MLEDSNLKEELKTLIKSKVIIEANEGPIVDFHGGNSRALFDFRRIFFTPDGLNLAADIFWDKFEREYPFQVAGLESGALPLIAAIVMRGFERGKRVNGFFIRKSRNKKGLLKTIEGSPTKVKTILVDDLINRGAAFLYQVTVLEEAQIPVHTIFAYVRFRDLGYYHLLRGKNVQIETIFTLEDFGRRLLEDPAESPPMSLFHKKWAIEIENPNYFYVAPKSAPVVDETKVYFGSDNGYMWALNQSDGSVAWKFKIFGSGNRGKNTFSSPALHNHTIYFGAYDGNFYALDSGNGKKKWTYMDADWISSSPVVSSDLNLVYVGLEFGFFKKRGGIVALDAESGKKIWEQKFTGLVQSSPGYSKAHNVVGIGSDDFSFYLLDAKKGTVQWSMKTEGEVRGGCAFDNARERVAFGSFDGRMYILDIHSGSIVFSYETGGPIYSTPCIYKDYLYIASTDKRVYCVNLKSLSLEWTYETSGRILASPMVANDKVHIGSNDGRFYELEYQTGTCTSFFQTTERITSKAAYEQRTESFFVLTFANQLFCLKKSI